MGDEGKEVVEAQDKRKASGGGFFSAFSAKFMGRSADKAPKEQQPAATPQQQQQVPSSPIAASSNPAQGEGGQLQAQQQQPPPAAATAEPHQQGVTSTYEETLRDLADQFSLLKAQAQLTVEQFDLRDTLGTGTFGRVRLVTFVHKGKPHHLALKMMKKSLVLQLKQVGSCSRSWVLTRLIPVWG